MTSTVSENQDSPGTAAARLSVGVKTLYGIGDMAPAAVFGTVGYLMAPFLLTVAGLDPYMLSIIFLVKFAWDAINDPIMGQLSDRTESRFGRRKVWILASAVPLGLLFLASWIVPDVGQWGKFAYYLAVTVLLDTFFTMHNVPYASLTAEMSDDYDERTSINTYRFGFSLIGSLVATVIFASLVQEADDQQAAYFSAAIIVAIMIAVTGIAPAFKTPERNPVIDRDERPISVIQNLKSLLSVQPFRHVIALFFCAWTAIQVVQTYLVLYLDYWLDAEGDLVLTIVYIQLSAVAFVIFYGWLGRRIGKKAVYTIGASVWALVFTMLFFLQPGQSSVVLFLAIAGGSGTAVALLIPYSMLPDVVDYDEAESGLRREGAFYGYFAFVNKIGRGIALAALSWILGVVGFQEAVDGVAAETQPDAVLLALRLFVSFVPATLVVVSIFVVSRYRMDEAFHADILRRLGRQSDSVVRTGGVEPPSP